MLTALVSLLSGLLTGALPEVIKEVRDTRSHRREIESLELQQKWQTERERIGADARIRESDALIAVQELQNLKELLTLQAKPTGVEWVDVYNAMLRPVIYTLGAVMFFALAGMYASGVVTKFASGALDVEAFGKAVWGSMIGEFCLGLFGYLFGTRGYARSRERA